VEAFNDELSVITAKPGQDKK